MKAQQEGQPHDRHNVASFAEADNLSLDSVLSDVSNRNRRMENIFKHNTQEQSMFGDFINLRCPLRYSLDGAYPLEAEHSLQIYTE